MPVTIQHLEIRFDVDGSEEEVSFVRLFQKYQGIHARLQRERDDADEASERDRALGDRMEG
jgi:hypothetical protein